MDWLTSFFLIRGFSYADASDYAFLIIFCGSIIGLIIIIRLSIFFYKNPIEWENIDWDFLVSFLFIVGFIILVIYVVLHFIIKYW
tara:strand:- start:389 stop:643 length:255 start_codon:yes stop_codon:yes gene_type:complete